MSTESTAPAWEKWDDFYTKNWKPVFDWLCDEVGLEPGIRLLDVASGTGLPARPAAARVRPGGSVLGTDVDEKMLEAAARRAKQSGLDNVEFKTMDAQRLELEDASFDAVTFAFGLMFCTDPARALGEIHRVLKPSGRFAIAVWDAPEKNTFLTSMFRPLMEFTEAPAPSPNGPGPFRFAAPGELEAVLGAGGFSEFRVESVPMTVEYESLEHFWQVSTELAAPVRRALHALDAGQISQLKERVAREVEPFVVGKRVRLTATPLCVSGRK